MKTQKIKRNGKRLLQVWISSSDFLQIALAKYGKFIDKRNGINGETFLYFNI